MLYNIVGRFNIINAISQADKLAASLGDYQNVYRPFAIAPLDRKINPRKLFSPIFIGRYHFRIILFDRGTLWRNRSASHLRHRR